ncbi:MAG: zinc ribbon domain-containing protein [Candidatus Coatesbacteria bacterium]|nr:MAG: zinc ribbon domain-containing protein [Candidatus Coatesbacteria bacterium]
MPLYGYVCDDCGKVFEVLVFAGTDRDISCPDCGSGDVTKLVSSFSTGGSGSSSDSCGSKYFS